MKKYLFTEIPTQKIRGYQILLDIDGTLVADSEKNISKKTLEKIMLLSKHNNVYYCSNSKYLRDDLKKILSKNIQSLSLPAKKPRTECLSYLENTENQPLLVIGDKIFTDGLFAKNASAKFILTKRIVSKHDSFKIKLINLVDTILGPFISLLLIQKKIWFTI